MPTDQPAPDKRVRTFAGRQVAYLCIAVAVPPSSTTGWSVLVEAELVRATGVTCSIEPAWGFVAESFDHQPTLQDLDRAIDLHVGNRLNGALETTELAMELNQLLKVHLGLIGYLTRNRRLEVSDTLRDASRIARELTMGDKNGEGLVCASVLVEAACGAHPAPPHKWSAGSPVGRIATEMGLVEKPRPDDTHEGI